MPDVRRGAPSQNAGPKALLDALAEFASWGSFYEARGGVLVCVGCHGRIARDGRQAHEAGCPVGVLDNAVLDHVGEGARV